MFYRLYIMVEENLGLLHQYLLPLPTTFPSYHPLSFEIGLHIAYVNVIYAEISIDYDPIFFLIQLLLYQELIITSCFIA